MLDRGISGSPDLDLSSSAVAATAGTAGVQCPANTYCPAASTAPTPCPAKTASSAGSAAASDCSAVAGYYVAPPGSPAGPDRACMGRSPATRMNLRGAHLGGAGAAAT